MNAARWQKVKGILEEALAAAPAERSGVLSNICNGDDHLRREVESLLEFENESAADLLDESAVSAFTQNGGALKKTSFIGKQIGRYNIVSELGAGGMGTVFLAERSGGEFRHLVAIKLIKHGLDSDSILRRFESERQILATLNHPNIAHLIDGGTTEDGLPYFVMEYVQGETIIDFARNHGLGLEQRLDLFRKVCSAVSFAHQNLVIHRDLKPTNILVNADGTPKLLDFGIAKLLKNEISGETATQHFIFTPEYASPEQIRGERLATATDVYSLGVILYELLTGVRPFSFDGKNFGQILQTVTRTEPARPSSVSNKEKEEGKRGVGKEEKEEFSSSRSLSPLLPFSSSHLRGDLDNIILKALNKLPERRYSSVEKLSGDIHSYLRGLPVAARQDTIFYRIDKFVHRNPFVTGAAALTFFMLIGGIAAVGWQARIANAERAKAERRFNDVRALANSFIFEVNEKIAESPIQARELLVTRSIEYLDTLAAEADGDDDLQSELAAAYEKIGNVQSELFSPSIGKTSEALVSHHKALEIREKLFKAEPNDIARALDVTKSLSSVGDILSMSGRVADAAESYRKAISLNENLLLIDQNNVAVRRALAGGHGRLGQAVLRSGSLAKALENYNRSLEIYQNLLAETPSDMSLQRAVSIIFSYIGYVKMEMGDYEGSVGFFRESLGLTENLSLTDAANQQSRGIAHLWLGVALNRQGKSDESLIQIRLALDIQTEIFRADKGDLGEQNSLADCYLELGGALATRAETHAPARAIWATTGLNEAITAYETAIENYEAVWQTDRENLSVRRQISFARNRLADVRRQKGEPAKALQIFRETLKEFEDLTQKDPNNTEWQHDLATCHLRIGEILSENRDRISAVSHLEKANSLLEKLSAASPDSVRIKTDLEAVRKHRQAI